MSVITELKHPRVGVGIIVCDGTKVLLGERRGAHGQGTWAPPGGHLDFGETPQECVKRELFEETGLLAESVVAGPWTNDIFTEEDKHYITLFMHVPKWSGALSLKEPEKCMGWEWFEKDALPHPLFVPLQNLISLPGYDLHKAFA